MLETFLTAFAAGWGLIAAVVSCLVLVGLVDALTGAVKTAKLRPKIKMHLGD